jgi:hypothetical protein
VAPDRELDPAAVDHERAHRLDAGLQDPPVGVRVGPLRQRRGLDLGRDRFLGRVKSDNADAGPGAGDPQAGGLEQRPDQVEVARTQ